MKTNKNIRILFLALLFSTFTYAQVGINTTTIEGAGIIDFATGYGIVLPWIETPSNTDTDGTLIYDITTNKVKAKVNGGWRDLSGTLGVLDTNREALVTTHLAKTENSGNQGVIIGSDTSTARGVLVLESTDKALILPKMASPHLNMVDPEPGTIVYDTNSNKMCVFNGSMWTFWGI